MWGGIVDVAGAAAWIDVVVIVAVNTDGRSHQNGGAQEQGVPFQVTTSF